MAGVHRHGHSANTGVKRTAARQLGLDRMLPGGRKRGRESGDAGGGCGVSNRSRAVVEGDGFSTEIMANARRDSRGEGHRLIDRGRIWRARETDHRRDTLAEQRHH